VATRCGRGVLSVAQERGYRSLPPTREFSACNTKQSNPWPSSQEAAPPYPNGIWVVNWIKPHLNSSAWFCQLQHREASCRKLGHGIPVKHNSSREPAMRSIALRANVSPVTVKILRRKLQWSGHWNSYSMCGAWKLSRKLHVQTTA